MEFVIAASFGLHGWLLKLGRYGFGFEHEAYSDRAYSVGLGVREA